METIVVAQLISHPNLTQNKKAPEG